MKGKIVIGMLLAFLLAQVVEVKSQSPTAYPLSTSSRIAAKYFSEKGGPNASMNNGNRLQNTTDSGTGQALAFIEDGDWFTYKVHVEETGVYKIEYRVASNANNDQGMGNIDFGIQSSQGFYFLDSRTFPSTGSWTNWVTFEGSRRFHLYSPSDYIMKIQVGNKSDFNLNWFKLTKIDGANCSQRATETNCEANNPYEECAWWGECSKCGVYGMQIDDVCGGVTPTLTPVVTPEVTPETTPEDNRCKWCGDKCVPKTMDISCTLQAPPVGAECKKIPSSGVGCGIFYDGGNLPSLPVGCRLIRSEECPRDQVDGCEYKLDCSQKGEVCPMGNPSRRQGNSDCDQTIGILDYSAWYAQYLTYLDDEITRSDWTADFDFNGKVDIEDFSIWYANYVDSLRGNLTPMPIQIGACNVTPGFDCQLQQAGCLSSICCPVEICLVAPTGVPPTEVPLPSPETPLSITPHP